MSEEEEKVEEEEASAESSETEPEAEATAESDADDESDAEDDDESDAEDEESDEDESEDASDEDDESDADADSDASDEEGASIDEMLGKDDKPKKKKKKKTGRKKKQPKSTAGQRLAAAKAAKAAKKAAARGKQAELVEDEAAARADKAAGWLETNRGMIMAAAVALLVAMGGYFAYDAYSTSNAGEASALLWDATQTLNAPVTTEEPSEDAEDEDAERYDSIDERADAAIAKLDSLLADYGSTDLAPWAQVLRGRALYQKGEHEAAREAFTTALSDGGSDVRPRALEGIAFTYESEEAWDEAISRFEELRSDDDAALSILADYHIARVHIARDNEEQAKEKLQAVLDALREEGAPELGYVRDQAELRLMAIDSSLVQRSTPDSDEMRRLIEQLQQQQAAEGG